MKTPYEILDRKRRGETLSEDEVAAIVRGAVDGSWADAQLSAFLMATAIHGLNATETRCLTLNMLESGERWRLSEEIPTLGDKHSTGGVGDKISLVLAPVLAACGLPVAMLTGRGLGHTGGTADKLEGIPGVSLELSRQRVVELSLATGMAVGVATEDIAPADRKLYALRDVTGTVSSIPLIAASILSKKLALGAAGVVYDVKTGSGAFLTDAAESSRLAALLVETSEALGARAVALVSDMSQPLGRWVGHHAEVAETLSCLRGEGPADIRELVVTLGVDLATLLGFDLDRRRMESVLASGESLETFMRWAEAQGARSDWLRAPDLPLAPIEIELKTSKAGWLAAVDTRRLGLLLAQAGGGRLRPGDEIDHGVALCYERRLGDRLEVGDRVGRVFLRRPAEDLVREVETCFEIASEEVEPGPLIVERLAPDGAATGTDVGAGL